MKKVLIAAVLVTLTAEFALANQIERACVQSDRKAASRALCGCIQDVADLTLTSADQKLASGFFKDPQKSQDIRQSDRRSHEAFWKRYKEFGLAAQTFCN